MSAVLESITHVEEAGNDNASAGERSDNADQSASEGAAGSGAGAERGAAQGGTQSASATGSDSTRAGDGPQGKVDVVPHAALHEARSELKQLRAKIAELESQPKLSADELAALKDLRETRAKAQEAKDPDFLEDPKGYVDSKVTKALKKLEEVETGSKETKQTIEQQRFVQAVSSNAQQQEAEFTQKAPDYRDALTHARQVRANQLKMIYPQATEQQIAGQLLQEEFSAAAQILQSGGNVAEFAYNYAKTLGYQPKAAPATDTGGKQPDKDAARTLGSGGGGASNEDGEEGDAMPVFSAALAERFGVKKRK